MKKILFIALIGSMVGMQLVAQDAYDAERFSTQDLNGTARYVGMGGALGALGGDISVIADNPAGIGTFKKSDMSFTLSAVIGGEKGVLGHDKSRASFDQAGIVLAMPNDGDDPMMNIAFNYHKKRNYLFNQNTVVNGLNGGSQTNNAAALASYAAQHYDKYSIFEDLMTNSITSDGLAILDGNLGSEIGTPASYADYRRSTYGSSEQFDVNVSFNINNKLFLGLGAGIYTIDKRSEAIYFEDNALGGGIMYNTDRAYDVYSWNDTRGDGVDLKLGAIIRPIDNSPFRMGVAIHTPIWYRMRKSNGANTCIYPNLESYNTEEFVTDDFYDTKYDFRTPWKFDFSLGTTIGNNFAIGAEYQIQDLSTCKYKAGRYDFYGNGFFAGVNNQIKESLQTQHTLKLGMEIKPSKDFAVRLGYNFVSAPMKEGAYRDLGLISEETETAFTNWKATNRVTAGLGYKFKGGYFDLAYQYSSQKGDFYAFSSRITEGNKIKPVANNGYYTPTEINNNRHQIMATLGFRF